VNRRAHDLSEQRGLRSSPLESSQPYNMHLEIHTTRFQTLILLPLLPPYSLKPFPPRHFTPFFPSPTSLFLSSETLEVPPFHHSHCLQVVLSLFLCTIHAALLVTNRNHSASRLSIWRRLLFFKSRIFFSGLSAIPCSSRETDRNGYRFFHLANTICKLMQCVPSIKNVQRHQLFPPNWPERHYGHYRHSVQQL
jgi:hypothetical protein